MTKPLEDSLAGIEGVDVITSISRQENSQISVRFKLERNPDSAAADVRDRVSRVRNKLPDRCRQTGDRQGQADANPIIWLAFSSDVHSALEVTDVASPSSSPRLQTCRAPPTCACSASASSPCASGSTPTVSPPRADASRRREALKRRTSRCRPLTKAPAASSRWWAQTDLTRPAQFERIIVKQVVDRHGGSQPVPDQRHRPGRDRRRRRAQHRPLQWQAGGGAGRHQAGHGQPA